MILPCVLSVKSDLKTSLYFFLLICYGLLLICLGFIAGLFMVYC